MKVAVNKDTLRIVDILPNNATDDHAYLKRYGYALLDAENVIESDGSFRALTEDEITKITKVDILNEISSLELSLLRPIRELLSTTTDSMVKIVAQSRVDEIEEAIRNLRTRL